MILRRFTCAAVALAFATSIAAQTTDRSRHEAQARRVNDRMRALQLEADRLAVQARTLLGELRGLEIEQQLQIERVKDAQAAVARGRAAIERVAIDIDVLEQTRLSQLPDLKVQLVDIYKRGRTGYARLLFASAGVREFGRATRAVAALMRINERRIAEHRRTLDALHRQRAVLEQELSALQARETEERQAQTAATRAVTARTALVARIDGRRDLNAQFAGELQLAHERLQQQIANAAAGRVSEAVAVPLAPFRGALEWPVPGRVTVGFGQSSRRTGDAAVRNGVEIGAEEDMPVHAIHPGTVSYADVFTGFGNLVIVDHGANAYSLYGYLASMSVARGAPVDAGAELGRVGLAPAGPPALYFEVRIDGRSVDPVQWMRAR